MGLCARFGWLPSQAYEEDWAELAELQARLVADDAEQEFQQWQDRIKAGWQTTRH